MHRYLSRWLHSDKPYDKKVEEAIQNYKTAEVAKKEEETTQNYKMAEVTEKEERTPETENESQKMDEDVVYQTEEEKMK